MKKTIAFGLILLLMPLVYAQETDEADEIKAPEAESYTPPINGIGYWIKITLPEYFISVGNFFDKENRVNWKLQQLERRRAELAYLLEKLNATQSTEWRERYDAMIKFILKRQEQNLKKLERYSLLLNQTKKGKIKQLLEQRNAVLTQLRDSFSSLGNTDALEGIDNAILQGTKINERLTPITEIQGTDSTDVMQEEGVI